MHRKKEISIVIILLGVIGIFFILRNNEKNKKLLAEDETFKIDESIKLYIDGEIDRSVELVYTKPITYGFLFMRLNILMNEYSDISSFPLDEIIYSSIRITIPSMDICNNYTSNAKIDIHNATISDLIKLPQIGEKRAQKILDYISLNGRIDSWDKFFKIASIPEHAKDKIKQQAFL